jgi:fibronectin type 3 domain-containing protein
MSPGPILSQLKSVSGVVRVSQGHSVNLSWNASTFQKVIGYNVFRGLQSGGPYNKINSILDPNLAYRDTSVADGTTYYYLTASVNSSAEESVYSNEAQATIP